MRFHKDKYKAKDCSNNKQQSNIDTFVTSAKCPSVHAKKITELVPFMVAKDLRPATIVEGDEFK